jgi:hypothetical protein
VPETMQLKLQVKRYWLQKAAICMAFLCFLSAKDVKAYGLPPVLTVPPVGITVSNGDTATFTATVGVSLTPLTFRWYLEGNELKNPKVTTNTLPITGTTICTLTVKPATPSRAGNYWVKVENGGGEVKSGNALLVVVNPPGITNIGFLPSLCAMTNGGFQLRMFKPEDSNCVIEATTDFNNWTPIYTNTSTYTNLSYLDSDATNFAFRYYRARYR